MQELKRILSLVVVFAMLLSVSAFASDGEGEAPDSGEIAAVTAAVEAAESAVETAEAAVQTIEAVVSEPAEVEVSAEAVKEAAENFDVAALAAIVGAAAESAKADAQTANEAAQDVRNASDELQKQVGEGKFEYVADEAEYEVVDEESGETYTTTGAELAEGAQAVADGAKEAAANAEAASENAANAADAAQYALEASDAPATEEDQQAVDTAKEAAVEAAGKAEAAKEAAAEVEAVIETATATAEEAAVIVAKAADAAKDAAEAANKAADAAKDAADAIARNLSTIENADNSHTEDEVGAAKAEVVEKAERAVELAKVADEKAAVAKEAAARAKDATLSGEEKAQAIADAAKAAKEATAAANEAADAANEAAEAALVLAAAKGWPFYQKVVTAKGVIVTARAQAGVFPQDTVLTVEDVEAEVVENAGGAENISVVTAVDINFWLGETNIQPDTSKGLVDVTIEDPNAKAAEGAELTVGTIVNDVAEEVEGATFEDGVAVFSTDHFTVYYVAAPKSEYVAKIDKIADNVEYNTDDTTPVTSTGIVQSAGGKAFYADTLANAVAAAASGATITLLNKVVLSRYVQITKTLTIDLNGQTITVKTDSNNAPALYVTGGHFILDDTAGTGAISIPNKGRSLWLAGGSAEINGGALSGSYAVSVSGTATLTVNGGSITGSTIGIYETTGGTAIVKNGTISAPYGIYGIGNTTLYGGTVTGSYYGAYLMGGSSITVDGGTVSGTTYSGISLAESATNVKVKVEKGEVTGGQIGIWAYKYDDNVDITINGGTVTGTQYYGICDNGSMKKDAEGNLIPHDITVTINGGTIEGGASGIYKPQSGKLTITDGTVIGGYAVGLEVRAGDLEITGGTITSNASSYTNEANGNGGTTKGAAVSVAQHTTKVAMNVVISGGMMSGPYALSITNPQNNVTDNISASVTGGTYAGNIAVVVNDDSRISKFISGGVFNTAPDVAYIADNYTAYQTVGASTYSVLPSGTSYNVTVNYNRGGSDSTTQTIEYGKTFTVPAAPSLAGYRFTGWSGGYSAGQQVAVTGDITLTAGWELIVYDDSGDDSPSGNTANTNQQNNNQQQNNDSSTETIEDVATPLSNTDSVAVNEETTTNADGSTTTTTDYLDGSKTEVTSKTTENADGSKTTTSTGTLTDANGAKTEVTQETTTKTNSDGSTTAKTTSTETKSDGTTTKTESETTTKTASDGAKTETTTATATSSDGTKTETKSETVTAADGSSKATSTEVATAASGKVTTTATETVTTVAGDVTETKDISDSTGSKGTTVTENGVTTSAEATITTAAVTEAKASNEAVTLPVSVTAAESASEAATVSVTLPATAAGTTKVEVPVTAVTTSTVAYVKNADGELELMKDCIVTENGVALGIEGSSEIVIVDNAKDFDDMPEADWASEAVQFVASREIFGGTSESTFEPKAEMSRGMVTQILFNFDRESEATGTAAFADTTGKWFDDAAGWASSIGVITGDNGEFKGENSVTRQDLATMLYRYAETKGYKIDGGTSLSAYGDADSVSEYAAKAMEWAVGNGLIGGTDVGLEPQANATREQVAAIMMRFCAKIK